jgi:hypothetical protein
MSEGLNANHTILGIHMVGNKMNTDSFGFLKNVDLFPISQRLAETTHHSHEKVIPDSKLFLNNSSN